MNASVIGSEPYISDDEVVSRLPGRTKGNLAQLRYTGKGPKFYKPSPRIVLYKWSDVQNWIEDHAQTDAIVVGPI